MIVYTLPSIWQYPFFQNYINIPVFGKNRQIHKFRVFFVLYCLLYCLLVPLGITRAYSFRLECNCLLDVPAIIPSTVCSYPPLCLHARGAFVDPLPFCLQSVRLFSCSSVFLSVLLCICSSLRIPFRG